MTDSQLLDDLSTSGEPAEPAQLWAVDLERHDRARIYVRAEHADEARLAATELVESGDWVEDVEIESDATRVSGSNGQRVWVGGEDGDWGDPV